MVVARIGWLMIGGFKTIKIGSASYCQHDHFEP
jgi:hypothetical protein